MSSNITINALMKGFDGDPTTKDKGWIIKDFWPKPPQPIAPEFLPPEIERIFLQGESNFSIKGNEEASGMMYRKALDVALTIVDPSLPGTLSQRIKKLATVGKITGDLADWADQIRALGNIAAHEADPPSRADLADLRSCTELVLRYLFTLPNMIKKRRGEKLPWEL